VITTGGPNIFVAAFWRSGSMHIANTLAKILGWRKVTTVGFHGEGLEEQNVQPLNAFILLPYGQQVLHQHTKGTPANVQMLQGFNTKIIVCTRNLMDSLVSLKEWSTEGVLPGLQVPNNWAKWEDSDQYDWLIRNAVPWYLSFYYSWHTAEIDTLWIDYEKFYSNQVGNFKGILKEFELGPYDDEHITDCASKITNLRTGKSGRGFSLLSPSNRAAINEQIDAWGPEWAPKMKADLLA